MAVCAAVARARLQADVAVAAAHWLAEFAVAPQAHLELDDCRAVLTVDDPLWPAAAPDDSALDGSAAG